MTTTVGPRTEAGDQLHAMKYRKPNEDFREAMNRVSFKLADDGTHFHEFRDVLLDMRFCPGGRVQGAAGATRQTTAQNCYVSGTLLDSLVDGDGCIMDRLKEAAATSKMGGGIGYDFSPLRPRGDPVRRIESNATGPVSFMEYFNTVGLGVASSGHRRGAQMAILRVDHPDIEEFVRCKQRPGALEGFNISVGVTDEFMRAVGSDDLFQLKFGDRMYREIRALDLWEAIMRSTWDWAEPGTFFVDTTNRVNNLWYCEELAATNPCGEQPLPPYGACLLGSYNLPRYLSPPVIVDNEGRGPAYTFDYDLLKADIPIVVRAMDNVIDRTRYPLSRQYDEQRAKRRMGLGVMGLANAGEALGYPYGSEAFVEFEEKVLCIIRDECYRASAILAAEKGSFPLFDADKYLDSKTFASRLPDDVKHLIKTNGIRNSHLTSIAPTGTISLCADNVSSGVEPVFAEQVKRKINTPTGQMEVTVEDYSVAFLGIKPKVAADVTAEEHVAVLLAAQRYVDSAVSKTINMDGDKMSWTDFKGIYEHVWRGGGKGCTTFNSKGRRMALLAPGPITKDDSCEISPDGKRNCE